MASDDGTGLRDEFLAEAQEIVEALSRDLLVLDQAEKDGTTSAEQINDLFRSVHTLKGIAGMFGHPTIGALAHSLEDLLDQLRLQKVALTASVLDVLFEGVEHFQRLLQAEDESEAGIDFDAFAQRIGQSLGAQESGTAEDPLRALDLDEAMLSVLTEYEEHRLRANVEQGVSIFQVGLRLPLLSIDASLENLKEKLRPVAEIITYLPSMEGGDAEHIQLIVLIASASGEDALRAAMPFEGVSVDRVKREGEDRATSRPAEDKRTTDITDLMAPSSAAPSALTNAPPSAAAVSKEPEQLSVRSVSNTVRVEIDKLDHLMNVVGELAIIRSAILRISERFRNEVETRELSIELHRINRGFERNLLELQNGILDVRMVPLGQVFDKLARIVRQAAREHGKDVRLLVSGKDTEVDKLIVEELSDPLMHIIRNAIDHGIEPPKSRDMAGKPPTGTLALSAYQRGKHVVIEVEDDGGGLDHEAILRAGIDRGVITRDAAAELSRAEIYNLIFTAGFSTKKTVSDLSGRGVGMDVVKTNIARLGGIIDVDSEPGIGTKFTITLPVTLAMISALLVRVAGREFAIPITSVREALVFDEAEIRMVESREMLTLRGSSLPICRLREFFGIADGPPPERQFIVVAEIGSRRVGFLVDELDGQQDIVIKSFGRSLQKVKGFAGATDLGDQRVALVIDVPSLVEESGVQMERARLRAGEEA